MKKLYFIFAASIIIIIALLIFSFLFFEKEKHKSLIYTIWIGGENIGYIKADRYRTEDKIIYKSADFRPKEPDYRIVHEKTIFNKKGGRLEKFTREYESFGQITKAIYIRDNSKAFDFLTKNGAKWSSVTGIAHAKDISVFALTSIISYMPVIDKYDFTRGGAQSFNVLYLSEGLLPPARGRIIFRSIRDEYVNVEGRKTKTEVLVIKSKILPIAYLWVSKKDRSIVRLSIEDKSLLIKKVTFPRKYDISNFTPKSSSYGSLDILFPSGDIALAGTIAVPNKKGKLPAILLVAGEGPHTRENAGLYTDIANELARGGFIVLRFDRRGIGKSQGDNSSVSLSDEIKDIENALKFLSNHEKADKDRVLIIAHGEVCSYLSQLDFSKYPLKGTIMLSASEPTAMMNFDSEYNLNNIKMMTGVDEKYAEILDLLKKETLSLVKNTKKEYIFAQGKHLFARRMAELLDFRALEGFKNFDIPFLLIYGKKDRFGSPDYINGIEAILAEVEPQESRVVYFRNLGHFLGKLTDENNTIKHYRINAEAMETIKDWAGERCVEANLTNP